ncbi:M20 family peptidase [Azohydromonas caseinilytica]|uniref:M20 family peptidase n=1 Tax=Azohydromonas caseinilytica TaxID=2728836 RepID=A0A848FFK5_9BURK|nr:M20 family peptidase [Azohydromonas caseinilytica]NML16930.1 M20 family peptidase [Azohydromonas caseinilytica]
MTARRLLLAVLSALALLVLVVLANTYRKGTRQLDVHPVTHARVDGVAAAQRLAGAVRLRTISHDDARESSAAEFTKLHAYLRAAFPLTHRTLKREIVGGYSLLYTWQGTDPGAKAIMLMAHQDVVPIADGTEKDWEVDPFAGTIKDGFIWGRGSWDDKGNLLSMLEAIESLLGQGFQPKQTIYLVAGHDEEVGGERGAKRIAELLASRSVRLDFVMDEGTLITDGIIKGLDKPVALIGVAEKGILTLAVSAHDEPGHASMPPRDTAIGMLSVALARLEQNQMPAAISGVAAEMFDTLAPEMQGVNRVLLSNLWLFGPLVKKELERSRSSNAFTRTTTALTVVRSGNKVNVVPAHAEAYVNFRLLPGDSQEQVIQHARDVIANPAVEVRRTGAASEASSVSSTSAASYRLMSRTIREIFPGTVVVPGLMVAATDSRHMLPLADHVYRFSPVRATERDLSRFHGTNERLSIESYSQMIAFYHRLISSAGQSTQP